jgi:phosphopantetheinyl transferase (holo-ACP synthase)
VKKYHIDGRLKRLSPERRRRFNQEHQEWIRKYVDSNPLAFLYEIKEAFTKGFKFDISVSTIYKILIHDLNYTKKKVERQAIQIRFDDICRYTREVNMLTPIRDRLIFLDEMSLDNSDMLRKRGWFLRNARPTFIGEFKRRKRISILAILGVNGLIDVFEAENTFNRTVFFSFLRKLVNSKLIRKGSILIMDGAKIHLDQSMVN